MQDGVDVTSTIGLAVSEPTVINETSMITTRYTIKLTNVKNPGAITIVLRQGVLVDKSLNISNITTFTFSRSMLSSQNYAEVKYYANDEGKAYINELQTIDETGTNTNSSTYTPSSLAEGYNHEWMAEPFKYEKELDENGAETGRMLHISKSLLGWAVADNEGQYVYYTDSTLSKVSETPTQYLKMYGPYDEIPKTVTSLRAVWQEATVIFVSSLGNNSNNGLSPSTAVRDLKTAFGKLSSSGNATNQIVVVMDQINWTQDGDILNKNATITSVYGGKDYRNSGAKISVSANMSLNADITFDNIEITSQNKTVLDGTASLATGTYTNILIANYHNLSIGRGVTTQSGYYTFGAIVGGNYKTERNTGNIGNHNLRIERGRYNNIIIGSSLSSNSQNNKFVRHTVEIGSKKDGARAQNSLLNITGYMILGENENNCYAYNTGATQNAQNAYNLDLAKITIYSGTFTAEKSSNRSGEDGTIYLRTLEGSSQGKVELKMYGGVSNGNIYAGAANESNLSVITTKIKFYGGEVVAPSTNSSKAVAIFGQGADKEFKGNTEITLAGRFRITGDVYGGTNATTIGKGYGTGNTNVIVSSNSASVYGRIFGGSKGKIQNNTINTLNGYINGTTNITISAGYIQKEIYGGGNNCGVGGSITELPTQVTNAGNTNITITGGEIASNVYGGAYENYVIKTNINITGGTIGSSTNSGVYGGNNQDNVELSSVNNKVVTNIHIGTKNQSNTAAPIVKSIIYGSGVKDKVESSNVELLANSNESNITVYGGSNKESITDVSNINVIGGNISAIYGGSNQKGTVTKSIVNLTSGRVPNTYGGGNQISVAETHVNLKGATATNIYGGSNGSGECPVTNVELISGRASNVYGGGLNVAATTTNVILRGGRAGNIYGASNSGGQCTNTNVSLKTGSASNVYGAGQRTGANKTNVVLEGASITRINGGCYGGVNIAESKGDVANANVTVKSGYVETVYGGNYNGGTNQNATVNIQDTGRVTNSVYGGGYKSPVGTEEQKGSITVNIIGGTVSKHVHGGSREELVNANININVGKNQTANLTIGGNIYGAGASKKADNLDIVGENYDYNYVSVNGTINVNIYGSTSYAFNMTGSIFGAGNAATYNGTSNINIHNLGTSNRQITITSIQRATNVNIDNSYLELMGISDTNNYYKKTSYTFNRIDSLTLYNNTYIYLRRGVNLVKEYNSLKGYDSSGNKIKETVTIENGQETKNVDNRIYVIEGINVIFAKAEGDLVNDYSTQDVWSDVNGMTFFGLYSFNRTTGAIKYDIYDPNYVEGTGVADYFVRGSYVEGRHKPNHNITVDGFWTNIGDYTNPNKVTITKEYIEILSDGDPFYDWIVGEDRASVETTLVGSIYSKEVTSSLALDYRYTK